jgi:hypothetical protein
MKQNPKESISLIHPIRLRFLLKSYIYDLDDMAAATDYVRSINERTN